MDTQKQSNIMSSPVSKATETNKANKKSQKKLPAYYAIIPKELWQEADLLINYLKYFPFESPTECAYCHGISIRLYAHDRHGRALSSYYCRHCRKCFNRLTNTPFANMQRNELLGQLAELYLTGLSPYELTEQIDFVPNAIKRREKAILWLMQERYPKLHYWWINHHLYKHKNTTALIQQQQKLFSQWLYKLLHPAKKQPCPRCGKYSTCGIYDGVPMLSCSACKTSLRLTGQTLLRGLQHSALWEDYAALLMQGATNQDIAKAINIHIVTCGRWREQFLKQMEQLKLDELVYWIKWQRQRNRIVTITKLRKKNNS